MFVLEKQVKKLRTKLYRINSIYDETTLSYLNASLKNDDAFEASDASSVEFDLNESLIFNCSTNKFAQLYFKIELFIKKKKRKYQNELFIGKIVIGSINYCRTVNGFTQMDQTLRDAGNEVTFWHKVA
jgi:predicted membrane-bound spermidine synthase